MTFAFGTIGASDGASRTALFIEGRVALLDEVASDHPSLRGTLMDLLERWDAAVDSAATVAERIAAGDHAESLRDPATLHIRAPLEPRQVFCTGANYHRHVVEIICDRFSEKKRQEGLTPDQIRAWAEDMMTQRAATGQPYIFSRTFASYAGPFDDLVLPPYATEPDWEAELAVVFKTGGARIARDDAMSHVAGYMVVNDITNRDQIFTADPADLGSDWLHAKNNPGFFPMGPWIVPSRFVADPYDLRITMKLNGELMQDERSNDMIFDIARQIEVLTNYTRIFPGDVLATGSPAGNGTHYGRYLKPGDVMEVSVDGLGSQVTRCVAAD